MLDRADEFAEFDHTDRELLGETFEARLFGSSVMKPCAKPIGMTNWCPASAGQSLKNVPLLRVNEGVL